MIHHSDQGSQYSSLAFGECCAQAGVRQSMGSVGDCFDNTMCESFFATLECELLNRQSFNYERSRSQETGFRSPTPSTESGLNRGSSTTSMWPSARNCARVPYGAQQESSQRAVCLRHRAQIGGTDESRMREMKLVAWMIEVVHLAELVALYTR